MQVSMKKVSLSIERSRGASDDEGISFESGFSKGIVFYFHDCFALDLPVFYAPLQLYLILHKPDVQLGFDSDVRLFV